MQKTISIITINSLWKQKNKKKSFLLSFNFFLIFPFSIFKYNFLFFVPKNKYNPLPKNEKKITTSAVFKHHLNWITFPTPYYIMAKKSFTLLIFVLCCVFHSLHTHTIFLFLVCYLYVFYFIIDCFNKWSS